MFVSRGYESLERLGQKDLEAVKAALRRLDPRHRAHVLAWLCMYYDDSGAMFSPQLSRSRKRITLDAVEFFLVKVPKRRT